FALLATSRRNLCEEFSTLPGSATCEKTSRCSKKASRMNLLGSSKTTGVCLRLRTASDCRESMLTRKLGGAAGATASASRPTQPNSSPLFGAAVCQYAIEVKCENEGFSYPHPCTTATLPSL